MEVITVLLLVPYNSTLKQSVKRKVGGGGEREGERERERKGT